MAYNYKVAYREVRMPTIAECQAALSNGSLIPYDWTRDHEAMDQSDTGPSMVLSDPMPRSVKEIKRQIADAKVNLPSGVAMPEMQWGFNNGRRLDAAKWVRDVHEGVEDSLCFGRLIDQRPDGWQGGARVIVQCAVLAGNGQREVFNRALAAMVVANKLQASGVPTEVLFVWASQPRYGPNGVILSMAVKSPTIETIARLSHPGFFRQWGFAARADGRTGTRGYGDSGGGGSTIEEYHPFKAALEEAGMLKSGDILINWNIGDFDKQVNHGLSQYKP